MIWDGADVKIREVKCTMNVMLLNHPQTTLTPCQSLEKLSSTKPVPGAKKVGDHWFTFQFQPLMRKPIWRTARCRGQEATVRTGHGTTDWFQLGKGVRQGCILSPCLFTLYAEYIMRNVGLEETQAGIKISGRNINKLRYGDDTTVLAEMKKN